MKNDEYAVVKNKKTTADRELLTVLLILLLYIFLGSGAVSMAPYGRQGAALVLFLLGAWSILCIFKRRGELAEQLSEELDSMQKPPEKGYYVGDTYLEHYIEHEQTTQKKTEGYYIGDTYLERYIDDE